MLQAFLHVVGQEPHCLNQMRVLLRRAPVERLLERTYHQAQIY